MCFWLRKVNIVLKINLLAYIMFIYLVFQLWLWYYNYIYSITYVLFFPKLSVAIKQWDFLFYYQQIEYSHSHVLSLCGWVLSVGLHWRSRSIFILASRRSGQLLPCCSESHLSWPPARASCVLCFSYLIKIQAHSVILLLFFFKKKLGHNHDFAHYL